MAQQLGEAYHAAVAEMGTIGLLHSAGEKLARFLLEWTANYPQEKGQVRIKQTLTRDEIAQMIGSSRDTVTRLLADFRRRQLVQVMGSTLVIKNKSALQGLVTGWRVCVRGPRRLKPVCRASTYGTTEVAPSQAASVFTQTKNPREERFLSPLTPFGMAEWESSRGRVREFTARVRRRDHSRSFPDSPYPLEANFLCGLRPKLLLPNNSESICSVRSIPGT